MRHLIRSPGFFLKAALQSGLLLFVFALTPPAPAFAGNFSVSPVRLYMTPKDRAVAVTIVNEGGEALVMQAELYLWKQTPSGEDSLTPTDEIFLSPPIIKLAPNARQVVRLARLKVTATSEELTYRMILREIPEAAKPGSDLQVQVALAFSLPVFVTPPRFKPALACSAEVVSESVIRAVCENTGNAHALVAAIALSGESGREVASRDSGGYILPAVKRAFELKRADARAVGGTGKLSLTFGDGTKQTLDVAIVDTRGARP